MGLFLTQHILEPTREYAILDLVFCSDLDIIQIINVRKEILGSGDRHIITFEMLTQSKRNYSCKIVCDYKKHKKNSQPYNLVITTECVDWENHSLIVDMLCIHNHTLIIYDIICIMDWVACIILISLYCYIFIHYLLYYNR